MCISHKDVDVHYEKQSTASIDAGVETATSDTYFFATRLSSTVAMADADTLHEVLRAVADRETNNRGGRDPTAILDKVDRRRFLQTIAVGAGAGLTVTSMSDSVQGTETATQGDSNDWPLVGYDTRNSGHAPEMEGPANLAERWRVETEFDIESSPLVSEGTVYIASEDRSLYAVDEETGEIEWQRTLEESKGRASPAILDDSIFLAPYGSDGQEIHALDKTTGEERWSRDVVGGGTRGNITATNGTIYYGSSGHMIARRADDGEKLWEFFIDVRTSMSSSPAVADGSVYFGTTTEEVYSIDAETGEEEWNFSPFGEVWSDPAIVDDTVYVGSDDGNVYALDADSGDELWSFDLESRVRASPAVAGDTVYVAGGNTLFAIDRNDGSEIWRTQRGSRTVSPIVVDEKVYFAERDSVVAVDAETGDLLDRFETGDRIRWSSPAASSSTIFIGSTDGSLYALSESEFQVTLTEIPEEVIAGEELTVEFEIENVAASTDTQVVTVTVSDELVERNDIELGEGETYEGSFDYETDGTDVPEMTMSVATEDDEASAEVTVLEEAFFEVETDNAPEEVVAGEPIELDVAVTNTGDVTGTQNLVFEVDGERVDAAEGVELEGGEEFTDSFTYETVEADTPTITVSVATDDDEASTEIAVEKAEDEEGDTDAQDDEDEPAPADDDTTETQENDDSEPSEEDDGQVTDEEIPGFGVGSALAGLGGAAYLLKRRLSDSNTDEA